MDEITRKIEQLEKELSEMADRIDSHSHDGNNSQRINLFDIFGLFETVTAVPTIKASGPFDQIKIYTNGATLRLYWYDSANDAWHYVTATA